MASLSALALCAWVLAFWVWRLWLPTPQPPLEESTALLSPRVLARRLADAGIFATAAAPSVTTKADLLPIPIGMVLKGVYAPLRSGQGFAIVERGGRTHLIFVGEQMDDGLVLAAVATDHVEFERQGQRMRLHLIAQPATSLPTKTAFKLEAVQLGKGRFGLSRSAFLEAAKDPVSLAALGRFGTHPHGGVVLLESGTLLQQLGLQTGDVLTHLDGRPLKVVKDAGRLFQDIVARGRVILQALRQDRPVQVEIEVLP